jgi:hypothetical protein
MAIPPRGTGSDAKARDTPDLRGLLRLLALLLVSVAVAVTGVGFSIIAVSVVLNCSRAGSASRTRFYVG